MGGIRPYAPHQPKDRGAIVLARSSSHFKGEAIRARYNAPVYPLVASLKAFLPSRLNTHHPTHASGGSYPELLPLGSTVKHQEPFK